MKNTETGVYIAINRLDFSKSEIDDIENSSHEELKQKIINGLERSTVPIQIAAILNAAVNIFRKKAELEQSDNVIKKIIEN